MKPLTISHQMLTWVCLCPADESTSKWRKRAYTMCGLGNFLINVFGLGISVAFFVTFVSIDLEKSLCSVLQIGATLNTTYAIIVMFLLRHKIAALFDHLSTIYEQRAKGDMYQYLIEVNIKSEWLWNFFFKYVLSGFFFCTIITATTAMLLCWMMHRDLYIDQLYHAYQILLPWDQTTRTGYFAELLVDICCGEGYIFANGILLITFVSICWLHRAFYEIFRFSVSKLENLGNKRNAKVLLCNVLRSHLQFKEWFQESTYIFDPYIFIQLICGMIFLASASLQLDTQAKHLTLELYIVCVNTVVGVFNLSLYCYFGKVATESFLQMGECLYEFKWHELPIELQQYFILMIQNSQRPLYYSGFGIAVLNLETFCKLIKNVFTFYMMFKTLTSDSRIKNY